LTIGVYSQNYGECFRGISVLLHRQRAKVKKIRFLSVTNCHTFSDPINTSSVTYFMDGPLQGFELRGKVEKVRTQVTTLDKRWDRVYLIEA